MVVVHASSSPISTIPPPGPPQTGPMSGTPSHPYFPYPNMPPHPGHPSLWYGQAPFYHPQFPLLHPQQYTVPPMMSVPSPPIQPLDYPLISEWLAQCDDHPQRSGEDFTNLVPKFDQEGFRCLHQLTGDQITVEKLSEWLGIGKGTADLILRYAEEDIVLMRISAQHVIPSHSRKYHTRNGDIVQTFYEYLCSHKDIHYGSMSVMSHFTHVYKPQSFRSRNADSSSQNIY